MTLGVSSWALRILDNVNDLQFVWDYRAILQSNNDTHRLGDSGTGMYPYTVYLLALVPGTHLVCLFFPKSLEDFFIYFVGQLNLLYRWKTIVKHFDPGLGRG